MNTWILVTLANALFAAAYLVKNIFWLRILSIFACGANMAYLYFAPDKPLWWGIGWDAAFIVINSAHVWILFIEQRTTHLGSEETDIYEAVFPQLSRLEFQRLLRVSRWEDRPDGDILAQEGAPLAGLVLLCRGSARVERNNELVTILKAGDFIGEMSYFSGHNASATVSAQNNVRILIWDSSPLQKLLKKDPGLKNSLDAVLSRNMADKLSRDAPIKGRHQVIPHD